MFHDVNIVYKLSVKMVQSLKEFIHC